MNNNSEDVVKSVESKNVESTSNEQRQTVKPIVISRRRLLRAGVAGIPVVLTMAGVAPGQSIMGQASAASGLVYGGTGVGVRERFDGSNKVQDNLVWSNNNGFVVDKDNSTLFTEEISTLSRNDLSDNGITLKAAENSTKTKAVTVTPKTLNSGTNAFTFNAYLHKSGVYYTDFEITKIGGTSVTPQTVQQFFESLDTVSEVLDYFTFEMDGSEIGSTNISDASVTAVSVEYLSGWTETEGYKMGSDSATRKYYRVPGSAADAIKVTLKVTASISGFEEDVNEGTQEAPDMKHYTYSCTSGTQEGTTGTITLTFNVSGQTYTPGT